MISSSRYVTKSKALAVTIRRRRNVNKSMVASSAQWTSSITATIVVCVEDSIRNVASKIAARDARESTSSANSPPTWVAMSARGPSARAVLRLSHAPQSTVAPLPN